MSLYNIYTVHGHSVSNPNRHSNLKLSNSSAYLDKVWSLISIIYKIIFYVFLYWIAFKITRSVAIFEKYV